MTNLFWQNVHDDILIATLLPRLLILIQDGIIQPRLTTCVVRWGDRKRKIAIKIDNVAESRANAGGIERGWLKKFYVNSLLVLQNFTIARKSGNILLTYLKAFFFLFLSDEKSFYVCQKSVVAFSFCGKQC